MDSNGSPRSIREQLRETRDKARLIEERARLRFLERWEEREQAREQHLSERQFRDVMEGVDQWDYLNTYSDLLDRLRTPDGALLTPISTANDRLYGANWPFWRTWTDHARLRGISRILVGLSPQAQGALRGLCSYVVGPKGATFRAIARKHQDTPVELVEAVQDIMDRFIKRNDYVSLQRECFWRDHRDGEHFLRFFDDPDTGIALVRTVEPEFVIEKAWSQHGYATLEQYSFGCLTPPGDIQKTEAFSVSYSGLVNQAELVDAADMHHVKIGVDRQIKRGLPDFVFDTYALLKSAGRALDSIIEAAAIQASIVGIRQHDKALASDAATFQQNLADYQRPNPFTGQLQNVQRIARGTMLDIPKGYSFVAPPYSQGVPSFTQSVQMVLRLVSVKWNAPEWLLSGDASNNNYASSLTAESPFLRTCQSFQQDHCTAHVQSFWRALRGYCDMAGGIKAKGVAYRWEDVLRLIDIQAEPTTLVMRDTLQEAQENLVYLQAGIKSPQTISQEQGLDYEQEQRNLEQFKARHRGELPVGGEQEEPDLAIGGLHARQT